MSDFKIPAVLKHLPSRKSPAFIAFCIFMAPRKAARGFRALSLILMTVFLDFYIKMVKTFTISVTWSSVSS